MTVPSSVPDTYDIRSRRRAAAATWSPMTAYYVASMLTIGLVGVIS